jgi:hypothetical protein
VAVIRIAFPPVFGFGVNHGFGLLLHGIRVSLRIGFQAMHHRADCLYPQDGATPKDNALMAVRNY